MHPAIMSDIYKCTNFYHCDVKKHDKNTSLTDFFNVFFCQLISILVILISERIFIFSLNNISSKFISKSIISNVIVITIIYDGFILILLGRFSYIFALAPENIFSVYLVLLSLGSVNLNQV